MRIFGHHIPAPLVVVAFLEAGAFVAAPILARAWHEGSFAWSLEALVEGAAFSAAAFAGAVAMGLYNRRQRERVLAVMLRAFAAVAVGVVAGGLQSYFMPRLEVGRRVLLVSALIALLLIALTRSILERLADEKLLNRRVLIYGAGRRALAVSQLRRRSDRRGISIIGFARLPGESVVVTPERAVRVGDRLLEFCREHEVDEVVVAMDDRRRNFPVSELLECRMKGIEIVDIVDFLERETGKVHLDVLNPSWIIFSPGFDQGWWRGFSKRALDLTTCIVLLVLTWPLLVLTAIAIMIEDGPGAPLLYWQERVGHDGARFNVIKFRSMRVDAESPGRAVWARKEDERVTRVGALIRKVRIDELPQIINVLRGDMSFVGPRPERPEFVAGLEDRIPYYRERHCMKPGITGWAQLCYPYGSSEQDAAEKLQYDLYYAKNHSLLFDVMILLQTAEVVLWGRGGR